MRVNVVAAAWTLALAMSAGAAPTPFLPAIATVVDPERFASAFVKDGKPIAPFVPVSLSGQGFRSDPAAERLRILSADCEWEMHALTPADSDRCVSGKALPCVVLWTDQRIVVELAHAMADVALRFPGGESPCIPVEHYRYDWFASDAAGDHRGGVPLALALDAQRRLWLNEEFHRDLKQLSPSHPVIRPIPIPPAEVAVFGSNLFARDFATHSSMLGEDVAVDPEGRVWLTEGGGSLYGTMFGGEHANHSRIVMFDPRNEETRVYNIPGNSNEITALAFDRRCTDGTSTGRMCTDSSSCPAGQTCGRRIWFSENARRKAKFFVDPLPGPCGILCAPLMNRLARELIPPRLAWFSVEPGTTPYTTNRAASFEPGTCVVTKGTCANRGCTQAKECNAPCDGGICADGSGRACDNGDCAGTCDNGLCSNWTCAQDKDCDSTCAAERCTDRTDRLCTASNAADCRGMCFTPGTCADTRRPCLTNDDCALERSVCDWNDPRRDCWFREYRLPGAFSANPRLPEFFHAAHVLVGRDGAIWYTGYGGGNHIGRLVADSCDPTNPQTCTVQVFPLSVPRGKNPAASIVGSGPWEIAEAADGDIVFTEFFDNTIGRFHTARLSDPRYDCRSLNAAGLNPCITEASIPVGDSAAVQTHSVRRGVGDVFWFTQSTDLCFQTDRGAESSIGFVRYATPESPQVVLFPPLSLYGFKAARNPCQPDTFRAFVGTGIAVDHTSGEVWFGDMLRRRIGRVRPMQ